MKFLTVAGALIGGSLSVAQTSLNGMTQCPRSIELLLVQDASSSFVEFADVMADSVKELIQTMDREIGKVKTSLAIFSDKPVPYRGNGQGRGYTGVLDVCYSNRDTYPLGNDPKQIEQGFRAIKKRRCEGGDYPEDPFEAMIYGALDPKVNWTRFNDEADEEIETFTDTRGVSRRIKHDAEGNTIVKLMVVVTDDHPHYEGEAYDGIYNWNPLPEGQSDGFPRFMDDNFLDVGLIYDSPSARDAYHELVAMHKQPGKIDSARYHQLLEYVGPAFYPTPLVHPGTFEANEDCRQYEYPNLETVGRVLNKEQILPIFLITPPQVKTNTFIHRCKKRGFVITKESSDDEWMECLHFVYTDDLKKAGFDSFIVGRFTKNRKDLVNQVVKLVNDLSMDYTCPEITTLAPEQHSTTEESTTVSEDNTSIYGVSTPLVPGHDSITERENETTADETTEEETTRPRTTKHSTNDETTPDADTTSQSVSESTDVIYTKTTPESATDDEIFTKTRPGRTTSEESEVTTTSTSDENSVSYDGNNDSSDDFATATDGESSGSTQTGTRIPVVPPVVPGATPSSSSNTGTIAGATGGAVAGTAALAGVLYKKFGASLLGHSGPSDLGAVEQVEVPETQVEREAFEEVTMDMFQ